MPNKSTLSIILPHLNEPNRSNEEQKKQQQPQHKMHKKQEHRELFNVAKTPPM